MRQKYCKNFNYNIIRQFWVRARLPTEKLNFYLFKIFFFQYATQSLKTKQKFRKNWDFFPDLVFFCPIHLTQRFFNCFNLLETLFSRYSVCDCDYLFIRLKFYQLGLGKGHDFFSTARFTFLTVVDVDYSLGVPEIGRYHLIGRQDSLRIFRASMPGPIFRLFFHLIQSNRVRVRYPSWQPFQSPWAQLTKIGLVIMLKLAKPSARDR